MIEPFDDTLDQKYSITFWRYTLPDRVPWYKSGNFWILYPCSGIRLIFWNHTLDDTLGQKYSITFWVEGIIEGFHLTT